MTNIVLTKRVSSKTEALSRCNRQCWASNIAIRTTEKIWGVIDCVMPPAIPANWADVELTRGEDKDDHREKNKDRDHRSAVTHKAAENNLALT